MCNGCKHETACKSLMGELPKVVGTCFEPANGAISKFDFIKSIAPAVNDAPRALRVINGQFA